ncbi:hypothetical protein C8Q72DRAFT_413322 [Fomitopsis betulina]|nr:hypothetical protein C8Q72DRAFT_413322 [Fomitopsis betulina]
MNRAARSSQWLHIQPPSRKPRTRSVTVRLKLFLATTNSLVHRRGRCLRAFHRLGPPSSVYKNPERRGLTPASPCQTSQKYRDEMFALKYRRYAIIMLAFSGGVMIMSASAAPQPQAITVPCCSPEPACPPELPICPHPDITPLCRQCSSTASSPSLSATVSF